MSAAGKVNSGAIYSDSALFNKDGDYGDIPRSGKQISDFATCHRKSSTAPENEVEMLLSYNDELGEDGIMLYHGDVPKDLWVMRTKRMKKKIS